MSDSTDDNGDAAQDESESGVCKTLRELNLIEKPQPKELTRAERTEAFCSTYFYIVGVLFIFITIVASIWSVLARWHCRFKFFSQVTQGVPTRQSCRHADWQCVYSATDRINLTTARCIGAGARSVL